MPIKYYGKWLSRLSKSSFDYFLILFFAFFLFTGFPGCTPRSGLEEARTYAGKSDLYYQHAVEWYKSLIKKGRDLDTAHFELGRLYFLHGEFDEAIKELRKTAGLASNKLIAISLYRMGNFTDALEAFSKSESSDSEFLYYYGLTSEKLNLFDKALVIYKKAKDGRYASQINTRLGIIEKESGAILIKDLDSKVSDIISTAPGQKEYPQAGALILFCDEKIELTTENTLVTSLHYIIKILNERGKENFSEAHIEYDSTFEKIELECARTIKPDGSVVEVGSRHIRDVSKYLNFPLYSNARVRIISFPEISEGAVLEYKAKIYKNQLINKEDFNLAYPVQTSEPVIQAYFTIYLPKARKLSLKTLNEKYNDFKVDLKPKIREVGDKLIYAWEYRDIPMIIPEPNMPAGSEINPTVLISTFDSWQEIYRWWWSLAQDKIQADSPIKEKVKDLIAGENSPEARIRRIYNFCAKEIRYVAVEYGQAGYEPHRAEDIFRNKYGDCKDQAILLVAMLKEAGLRAWPVLIPTRDSYNLAPDFPSALFDHCIAAVSLNNETIFLDPTAETCAFGDLPNGDQKRKVLVFMEDGYQIQDTPFYSAGHNLIKQVMNIGINNDESLVASKDIFTSGVYDQAQRRWLLYTPPELIAEALKEKIQEVSIGAKLKGQEIKNLPNLNEPVVLSYEFVGPEYFIAAGDLRIMPQLGGLDVSVVAKERRKYPFDFGVLDIKDNLIEINIPSGFKMKYIPENVREESIWLGYSTEYSYQNNRFLFKQRVELKKDSVSEEDYPEFKAFLEKLGKKIKQRAIVQKIK